MHAEAALRLKFTIRGRTLSFIFTDCEFACDVDQNLLSVSVSVPLPFQPQASSLELEVCELLYVAKSNVPLGKAAFFLIHTTEITK